MQHLPDPHHDTQKIDAALKAYFSVLRGFFEQPDTTRTEAAEAESGGLVRQGTFVKLSAFLQNWFLCQDCVYGDVPLWLGAALLFA